LARFVSRLFPTKRQAVKENLDIIAAWGGRRASVGRVFANFGQTLGDFLSRRHVEVRTLGRVHVENARAAGRGAIVLTSHLGNWELGGRVLQEWGWPATAVFQPYRSGRMQKFIQKRRAPGLGYLAVGRGAARGVARALERGEAVAILADRPFGEDGVPVTLCGRPARLPRGPFVFACRFGVPALPGFVLMERPGHYCVSVDEPLWPTGRGPADVQDLMDRFARVLEKYLAKHADQWYCFEPVWERSGESRRHAPAPGV
jgi:KDO2-lipid IV(A) lauroyltransferase